MRMIGGGSDCVIEGCFKTAIQSLHFHGKNLQACIQRENLMQSMFISFELESPGKRILENLEELILGGKDFGDFKLPSMIRLKPYEFEYSVIEIIVKG